MKAKKEYLILIMLEPQDTKLRQQLNLNRFDQLWQQVKITT